MRNGFTLVELLVVVTIIVILLALLAPALDKAIYQAELAVCGSRQNLLALSSIQYATGHKRMYPPMPSVQDSFKPSRLTVGNSPTTDRRVHLRTFLSINKSLNDPLSRTIDIEAPNKMFNNLYGAYDLWFGWRWLRGTGGQEKGMRQLGDRFTYTDISDGRVFKFNLLVSDLHTYSAPGQEGRGPYAEAGHPDRDGLMYPWWADGTNNGQEDPAIAWTYSTWKNEFVSRPRGLVDLNFAFDDGSVSRLADVEIQDKRLKDVALLNNGDETHLWIRHWVPSMQ